MPQVRPRISQARHKAMLQQAQARHGRLSRPEQMHQLIRMLTAGKGNYAHPDSAVAADSIAGLAQLISGIKAARGETARNEAMSQDMGNINAAQGQAEEADRQDDMFRWQDTQDFNRNKFEGQQQMAQQRLGLAQQKMGLGQQRWNDQMGLQRDKLAQQGGYQQQMLGLKQQSLQQKAQQAAAESALNPFKGDPQAMAIWQRLPSADDKRRFQDLYRTQGREGAMAQVGNLMQSKSKGALGSLFGGKEPSGKYQMASDPMEMPDRIMSYEQFVEKVLDREGDIPEDQIKQMYSEYLRKFRRQSQSFADMAGAY